MTSTDMDYAFGVDASDELSRDELRALLERRREDPQFGVFLRLAQGHGGRSQRELRPRLR